MSSFTDDKPVSAEVHSTYVKLSWQNLIGAILLLITAVGLYYKVDQWHRDSISAEAALGLREDANEKRIDAMEAQYRVDHDALTAILSKMQH